ncbi:MAG: hypothetical protein C0599_06515 [Salinivirgaceae bacterium]|nr:MAG: hypothetical protein C0599_06515 [Salinivirgaceae bacterium]
MIKKLIYSLAFILLISYSWEVKGQARVEASLDTTMMLIGDHIEFSISATIPMDASVTFPVLQDTLVDKIEILRDLPFDTVLKDGSKIIRKPWIITSFDSGSYIIKPMKVAVNYSQNRTDTLHTNPLYMGVITFNIDSTANAIADIKKPIETPLTFNEFLQEYAIWYGLIILVLALVFTLWWYFKKQQKKKDAVPEKVRPKEPPHVIALRELDDLSGKKLWQQDKIKLHYSILSDIVRQYLEYRFDVPAMENTTGFIEEWIEDHKTLNKENYDKVKDILEIADLAKFAKFNPLPDDNSRTLDYAYQLVISTKERIIEPEQPKETEKDEN